MALEWWTVGWNQISQVPSATTTAQIPVATTARIPAATTTLVSDGQETRICGKCGAEKSNKRYSNGALSRCNVCTAAKRVSHPEWRRNENLRNMYGLTSVDWAEMFEQQKGLCASGCGAPATQVDHCHECQHIDKRGSVRGLLCARCNRSLDHISQFSPAHAEYLAAHAAICPARIAA